MTKLPQVSGKDLIKLVQKLGFEVDRQRGSHITLVKENPYVSVTIPNHKQLKIKTLKSITRQLGLTNQ